MRHPPWAPDEQDLDEYARAHLSYEVRNAIDQAIAIEQWSGPKSPQWDALLEAFLMHIRLLDDFLGKAVSDDDVSASHYVHGKTFERFLDRDEIDDLNAQVAHLAARRKGARSWPVTDMTERLCVALEEFHNALPDERKPSLKQIPTSIAKWQHRCSRSADLTVSTTTDTHVVTRGYDDPARSQPRHL